MDVTEKVKLVVAALEDRKARDIRVIKVSGITTIADYFVICDGSNDNQLKALCDSVEEKLLDVPMKHREGTANGGWLLLDYYDIIVHIFSEEMRSFYDLERIWKDGTVINPGDM
ncbi:MAG: ribosome silencing factor [Lachnospiraceae bacterium]|nr:ribosome silencing factor [Lachnospiraceae bacterium]